MLGIMYAHVVHGHQHGPFQYDPLGHTHVHVYSVWEFINDRENLEYKYKFPGLNRVKMESMLHLEWW